jgi:guanylate kinase
LVVSSPSGAGKTTLCRHLLAADEDIRLSISATTRPMREGEIEGQDYLFLSDKAFEADKKAGVFLEDAKIFGFSYGTPRARVKSLLDQGFDVLFDINWQGAAAIAETWPGHVVRIFILPPSLEVLDRRLRERSSESADAIETRLANADKEIAHWPDYDYVIVNDDLEDATEDLLAVVRAERLKAERFHAHA